MYLRRDRAPKFFEDIRFDEERNKITLYYNRQPIATTHKTESGYKINYKNTTRTSSIQSEAAIYLKQALLHDGFIHRTDAGSANVHSLYKQHRFPKFA